MATNRKDVILPTKFTTRINISLDEYDKFKEVFWNKKVYDFHIKNKFVYGTEVCFDVRSMRVNEFVDILNLRNIKWNRGNL